MVVLCVYVEYGHVQVLEQHGPTIDQKGAVDQAVGVVKVDKPLLSCFGWMMRAVEEPLFHAQEVKRRLFATRYGFNQRRSVFFTGIQQGHLTKNRAAKMAWQAAKRVDQVSDLGRTQLPHHPA